MTIYSATDPALADAYRTTARSVRREQARDAFIAQRSRALRLMLATTPHGAIDAIWSMDTPTTVQAELVAWVLETSTYPDAELGAAMFNASARDALVTQFAQAYAVSECNALGDDRFDDAAMLFEQGGM